jgi:putative transcriptional regulator
MPNSPDTPIHLEGQLLLADPSLRDDTFIKSVIYLVEHNQDDGAYGLILNHPTDQTVGDLLPSDEFQDLKNIRVYIGGPISQEHLTFASFSTAQNNQFRLSPRISAQDAIKHSQQPGTLVRAFAGHSGWTSGQLENELRHNSWITTQPDSKILASEHEKKLWAKLLRSISPYHQVLAEAPDDIFVN